MALAGVKFAHQAENPPRPPDPRMIILDTIFPLWVVVVVVVVVAHTCISTRNTIPGILSYSIALFHHHGFFRGLRYLRRPPREST